MSLQGPITRATIRTSFVLALRLLVQTGTLLLVTRMLGPDRFGAFAGVAALAVIAGTLGTFGMHLVLMGEVSKQPGQRHAVLCYAIPSTLLCGTALLIAYLVVCLFGLREAGVSLTVLLAIGTAEILLQPLFSLPASEQLALGHIARSQLLTTLPLALRLLAAGLVLWSHVAEPVGAYAYGYLAASAISLGVALATMPHPWPAARSWRLPNRTELRDAAGYAALNITASSPTELDKTLATKLLPLSSSGLYTAGARIIGAGITPVIAMMLSALPRLFREGHANPQRTARLLAQVFVASLAYGGLLAAALWIAAPLLVWLLGTAFQGIEQTLYWLLPAIPGMALRIAAGSILMALGKPWTRVVFESVGLAVLIAAAIWFVETIGISGLPLALACSESTMAVLGWGLIITQIRKSAPQQHRATG